MQASRALVPTVCWPGCLVVAVSSCVGLDDRTTPTGDAVELPRVREVEMQPFMAQVARLRQGLKHLGSPLPESDEARLGELAERPPTEDVLAEVQTVLDRSCLAMVHVNPEARVSAQRGPAAALLMREGRRTFLVKVHNEAGATTQLRVGSPNALPRYRKATNAPRPPDAPDLHEAELANRFLALHVVRERPLSARLSGLATRVRCLAAPYGRSRQTRGTSLVRRGAWDVGSRVSQHVGCAVRVRSGGEDGVPSPRL